MSNPNLEADPIEEARAQAIEYLGFAKPKRVVVGGELFEIPLMSLMSREQQKRYNQLQLDLEELDRWPDTKNDDGEVVRMGDPKMPHRKKGKLVDDYDVRLTKAIFGDERGEFYLSNGGNPGDIALFWAESNKIVMDRQKDDSKSAGSVPSLAVVPNTD